MIYILLMGFINKNIERYRRYFNCFVTERENTENRIWNDLFIWWRVDQNIDCSIDILSQLFIFSQWIFRDKRKMVLWIDDWLFTILFWFKWFLLIIVDINFCGQFWEKVVQIAILSLYNHTLINIDFNNLHNYKTHEKLVFNDYI